MSLEPGFQLGHYRIVRSLGSGGMADVYEAHDDNLERTVALKILPLEYCRNPQLVQRFQKEVRAAAKLNHRNIVTVFEVGHQDSYHYFSMRLLTGGDLRRRIRAGLSPVETLAILRELADAFAHAHARGFVHRDVKPENIMFDEQGFPVLTDFGIAKALDANTHLTRTGMTMGTPRYLSPEQASGKPVDARADLYSLGIILYEMLTGRPPYDAEETMAVIFKHVTEPIPTLPSEFARYQGLLEKLMAKDPNQRIGSAEELIRAIDAVAPRGAGEVKPSQQRTTENPLIANLISPSPLRTPAPKTPRPATPPPAGPPSGEVIVRPPKVATRPSAAKAESQPTVIATPAPVAPVRVPAAPEPETPRPRRTWVAGGVAAGIAALGASILAYRAFETPRIARVPVSAPAPVVTPQHRDAGAEAAEQEAARKQAAETAARKNVEADAKRKSQAEAEARRQAEAEAKRQAEIATQQKAAADAAERKRAEDEAAAKAREEQRQRKATAEAARKKKEEEKAKAAEQEAEERARRPTGF